VCDHRGVTDPVAALVSEGREAYRRGAGAASRRAFEAALAEREDGEILEGLARALYLEVDYPASLRAHERAFAAYRREGDDLAAARAARMLAWIRSSLYGDWAVANGWLARAEKLLDDAGGDSAEHGWAEVIRAMGEADPVRREAQSRRALAIGRRVGDADLEFEALGWLGLNMVLGDRVEEGMLLLDEALAAVCADEVDDLYVVEGVFCGMFLACERTSDVRRAEQWIRAAHDIVRRRNLVAIGAFCRAHYGGILTAAGRWREAESELAEAARVFERGYVAMLGNVNARLADLRVRQGRLEEAAILLEGLDEHPDAAGPIAALRLARGETALARDLLERVLAAPVDAASAGPLLSLMVDVHLAEGDVDAARTAAERLGELAGPQQSDYLHACAALARGKVCIASSTGDARSCLHEALSSFARAGMPIELARTRLELARAVAADRPEVAVAEARAALESFERLQAARDADLAASVLRSLGAPGRAGPRLNAPLTRRETEVLELLGLGLSNPEIADRLVISTRTAEHHVGRVLAKLGLRNRAEAAAHAARIAGQR
jgi:DNA-binding NarL/FixJ family response regulator